VKDRACNFHTIRVECQFVINHFNNGKPLSEVTEIIQRTRSNVQYIVESYSRKTGLRVKRGKAPNNLRRM